MKTSFQIHNNLAELDTLLEQLQILQQKWSLPKKCLSEINLILDELITNAIQHGGDKKNYPIEVTLAKTGRELTIEVVDAGPPFDPTINALPDTSLPLEQRQCGGLGIYLAKKFCDCWHYSRSNNENVLILQKTLPKDCG